MTTVLEQIVERTRDSIRSGRASEKLQQLIAISNELGGRASRPPAPGVSPGADEAAGQDAQPQAGETPAPRGGAR